MEPIEHRQLLRKPTSNVRDSLILKWLFLGTLLALMYRSVLLATLVSVDYEKQGRDSMNFKNIMKTILNILQKNQEISSLCMPPYQI